MCWSRYQPLSFDRPSLIDHIPQHVRLDDPIEGRAACHTAEAEWRVAHPGQEPGPVAMSRLTAMAWDHERPAKKPAMLGHEAAWRAELDVAG